MAPKVSEEYKEERKAVLLNSALYCFAEKGYFETTIDDIVRHANASKGAVYHYFRSKEEIFLSLLEERTQTFFATAQEKFAACSSATDKVKTLFSIYRSLQMSQELKNIQRVHLEFFLYSARHNELKQIMQQRYRTFTDMVASILEEGKQKGEFRQDVDTKAIGAVFWANVDGVSIQFQHIDDQRLYTQIWEQVETIIMSYLK